MENPTERQHGTGRGDRRRHRRHFVQCPVVNSQVVVGGRPATTEIVLGLWDVFGALFLGIALGWPMAWLTGRLRRGEPAIMEAAGFADQIC
jgi:hypothetical protein